MAVTTDGYQIYNNVWKPDPMQGVDLQRKYLDIKNAQIQNQLLQQQEQTGGIDLQAKQNLSAAIRKNTNPKTGELDLEGFRRDTGFGGNVNQLDLIQKGNVIGAPTQAGINPAGQAVNKSAQSVATQFNTPNALTSNTPRQVSQQNTNALMPNNPAPNQPKSVAPEEIDNHAAQIDYMKGAFDDLAALPDDELGIDKLYEMGADMGAKHVETKGKLGIPYKMVASEMSGPDFPREGPNGEKPSPTDIRQFLKNHSARLGEAQAALIPHRPPQEAPTSVGAPTQPVELQGGQQPGGNDTGIMPGGVMAMPPGFQEAQQASRERINTVQNDATVANKTLPVLDEVYNLSKGGALTGQASGKVYSYLASHGLAVSGVTEPVQQLQEISKYMAQAAIAGGLPASDARLEALHEANTHPEQLPGTIQALVPFLRAQMKGAVEKQKFYNSHLSGSLSPDKEVAVKSQWDNNYDPRWLIFDELPTKGKERGEFLSEHPDMLDKVDQYENLNQMGVAKNHHKKK